MTILYHGILNNLQVNVSHFIVHFYFISCTNFPYILYGFLMHWCRILESMHKRQ